MYFVWLGYRITGFTEDHKRKFDGTFVCILWKTSIDELYTEWETHDVLNVHAFTREALSLTIANHEI